MEKLKLTIRDLVNCGKAIRYKMGYGYHHLEEALAGKRLNIWAVRHIESGLLHLVDESLINSKYFSREDCLKSET